ncbi:unnamed protein product [Lota lota]
MVAASRYGRNELMCITGNTLSPNAQSATSAAVLIVWFLQHQPRVYGPPSARRAVGNELSVWVRMQIASCSASARELLKAPRWAEDPVALPEQRGFSQCVLEMLSIEIGAFVS